MPAVELGDVLRLVVGVEELAPLEPVLDQDHAGFGAHELVEIFHDRALNWVGQIRRVARHHFQKQVKHGISGFFDILEREMVLFELGRDLDELDDQVLVCFLRQALKDHLHVELG